MNDKIKKLRTAILILEAAKIHCGISIDSKWGNRRLALDSVQEYIEGELTEEIKNAECI